MDQGWNNVSVDGWFTLWNWITYWMECLRMDGNTLIGFGMEYENVLYWIGFVVRMWFGKG